MFLRLSAHSPRDSFARRMCCSSWQILHLFSVRVEPGPEIRLSCPFASTSNKPNVNAKANCLSFNDNPHSVPAVPEIAERVPGRDRWLRVALVVPGARDERVIAGALGLEFVREAAPRILVAAAPELRALPGPAFVGGDLDAVDGAFADPRSAAHRDLARALDARVRRRRADDRLPRPGLRPHRPRRQPVPRPPPRLWTPV